MQGLKINLTKKIRCVNYTPENKFQEFSLEFIFIYSAGLFSVRVASKPSIRTAIPSKTMKVWITVLICI